MSTAITNVRVFDGKTISAPTSVVIDKGVIARGPAPKGADTVDGAGGTLLPGLIDTHAHVSEESHLRAAADWGVTTMLDMGARFFDKTMALRERTDLASLRTAGRPANGVGSDFVTKMGFPESTSVTGPDDAERWVADRKKDGSDYIKIIVEDPSFPGAKPLTADTIAAVVVAAHRAGYLTVAHVVSAGTMKTAVDAGVDVVTHTALTSSLGDEFERSLTGRDVVIVPTLVMMDGVARVIGGKPMMRILGIFVAAVRMRYSWAEATVQTFRNAGKTVLVGTDANDEKEAPFQPPHGESMHDELERLVRAGLTPIEALNGATSLAAKVFQLSDRGSITPGMRADLLLVDGDPTTDITTTRNIRGVWIGGVAQPLRAKGDPA